MSVRLSAFVALFLGLFLLSGAQAAGLPDFTELAAEKSPAVVNISTTQKAKRPKLPGFEMPDLPQGGPWDELFKHFFGGNGEGFGNGAPEREARSLGSGFVIDANGYIVTNNHVVEDADEIIVRLSDRRELEAQLVGSDPRSDIALLKVEADDLPVVRFGDVDKLKVGQWVMAIGSPFGFDHSVSVGVVSALGRSLPNENYVPFIQTDVAINPGNSGGPLFNLDGEVIGINSQIYTRSGGFMGLSFAIPVDVAMEVVAQLKESGSVSRGWLGVLIQDVTRELAESFGMERPSGALVAKVLDDSPAAEAGIEVGDIVIEFNGRPIIYSSDLPPQVGRAPVGKPSSMVVLRDGRRRHLKVVIGELPEEEELRQAGSGESARGSVPRVGLKLGELSAEQREQLGLEKGGLLITDVEEGPGARAGLRPGDVLLKLAGREVEDLAQFRELVKGLPTGRPLPLLVLRGDAPMFLAMRLDGE